jgi:hypothetical protein
MRSGKWVNDITSWREDPDGFRLRRSPNSGDTEFSLWEHSLDRIEDTSEKQLKQEEASKKSWKVEGGKVERKDGLHPSVC